MPAVRRARLPALRRADLVCDTAYTLSLTGLDPHFATHAA
jgi:hypothetical protein